MQGLWVEHTDEFYQDTFKYLKAKYQTDMPMNLVADQLYGGAINRADIVVLEAVHRVLRKIEDGSAPTLDNYKLAVEQKDDAKISEFITFYKVLVDVNGEKTIDCLKRFSFLYFWDFLLLDYVRFLKENDTVEDKLKKVFINNEFNPDILFDILNLYRVHITNFGAEKTKLIEKIKPDGEKFVPKNETEDLLSVIFNNNLAYQKIVDAYDDLIRRKIKFGLAVVEIEVFKDVSGFETETVFWYKVSSFLKYELSKDNGVLVGVNNGYIVAKNRLRLAYLVLFDLKTYNDSKQFLKTYNDKLLLEFGTQVLPYIKIIDQTAKIEQTFPKERWLSQFHHVKSRLSFKNQFLKYYFCSFFSLRPEFCQEIFFVPRMWGDFEFNVHYDSNKIIPVKRNENVKKGSSSQQKDIRYLNELVTDNDYYKRHKYFDLNDLTPNAIKRSEILTFLYSQIPFYINDPDHAEKMILIEKFVTSLIYTRYINPFMEYGISERKFVARPKFKSLSSILKQFLLIERLIERRGGSDGKNGISAICKEALYSFDELFPKEYYLEETKYIVDNLKAVKQKIPDRMIASEHKIFAKAEQEMVKAKVYLEKAMSTDMFVIRMIFRCGQVETLHKAEKFNEMFQDYIENLKRRSTGGLRLNSHIGVYITNGHFPYIDATLFFNYVEGQLNDKEEQFIQEVQEYWQEYVKNKMSQIQTYNNKHGKKYTGNHENPFGIFEKVRLSAKSIYILGEEDFQEDKFKIVYKANRRVKSKLINILSKYYAYCHWILVDEKDVDLLPRKNYLILGRHRIKKLKDKILKSKDVNDIEQPNNESIKSKTQDDAVDVQDHILSGDLQSEEENLGQPAMSDSIPIPRKKITLTSMLKIILK